MIMYPSLARFATDLDDAGRSAGATWWMTSRRLLLPLLRPAILGSITVVFITICCSFHAPTVGRESAAITFGN
jgi:ABC-type spermidine/putrescine transport system permease subunit II